MQIPAKLRHVDLANQIHYLQKTMFSVEEAIPILKQVMVLQFLDFYAPYVNLLVMLLVFVDSIVNR